MRKLLALSALALFGCQNVFLWEMTICESKPWIRQGGPFKSVEECEAWGAEWRKTKSGTFGLKCGTERDMGEKWRDNSTCPSPPRTQP